MTVTDQLLHELTWRGGTADAADLAVVPWRALAGAVADGTVVRSARGRYALPGLDAACVAAHRLTGAQSHLSAALAHGWGVAHAPDRPHVVVPRGRFVSPKERTKTHVHWRPVSRAEVRRGLTDPVDTVLDCARILPFGEALCVADSALRSGLVGGEELVRTAESLRGGGAARARRVAASADARSANPFESMLRAICLDVKGLSVVPQVVVAHDPIVRVDLADVGLGVVIEADSFEWHGSRTGLTTDAQRYNRLVVAAWIVLRFTHVDVFGNPQQTAQVLDQAVVVSREVRPRRRASRTTMMADMRAWSA